ncbi:MAG: hypothetical protein R2838_08685 [Caldilineaceae bacterium]
MVAKAMSNGYPMGAVVGSRAVMAARGMFISSSYWSDNIGLAASLTTIRDSKRRGRGEPFPRHRRTTAARSTEAIAGAGLTEAPWSAPQRADAAPRSAGRVAAAPSQYALHSGDGAPRRPLPDVVRATLAHTDDDIAHTAAAAYEACRVIKRPGPRRSGRTAALRRRASLRRLVR